MKTPGKPRGLLRLRPPPGHVEHRRVAPPPELAESIEHFWWVRWSLESPFLTETLPHPSVHVVFERDADGSRARITGVHRGRWARELSGSGHAFGVKFRPAAFQPLFGAPMSRLAERVVEVESFFGVAGQALAATLANASTLEAHVAGVLPLLRERIEPLPGEALQVRDLVERLAVDRSVLRVEDAANLLGHDVRGLQRQFRHWVGVAPKWVIQRYRLHEAAERLLLPSPPSLAELALDLGYVDQAHFSRDFAAMVGRSPARFARDNRV